MEHQQAHKQIYPILHLVIKGLENVGIPPLKARDKREPGRKEKMEYEDALRTIVVRHFVKQKRIIRDKLTAWSFMNKKLPEIDLDEIYEDDEFAARLMKLLQNAIKHGVNLFGENSAVQIDWTLTNKRAIDWARKYTYDLVKEIDDTTRKVLKDAISQFVGTPGMTLRDVMDLLPFNEERAQRVAVTEITRTYARANQLSGEDLKKEFPDVRVVKIWYSNNDDIQCPICGELDGKEIDLDEDFYSPSPPYEDGNPPRHVACRCWEETTTTLND